MLISYQLWVKLPLFYLATTSLPIKLRTLNCHTHTHTHSLIISYLALLKFLSNFPTTKKILAISTNIFQLHRRRLLHCATNQTISNLTLEHYQKSTLNFTLKHFNTERYSQRVLKSVLFIYFI